LFICLVMRSVRTLCNRHGAGFFLFFIYAYTYMYINLFTFTSADGSFTRQQSILLFSLLRGFLRSLSLSLSLTICPFLRVRLEGRASKIVGLFIIDDKLLMKLLKRGRKLYVSHISFVLNSLPLVYLYFFPPFSNSLHSFRYFVKSISLFPNRWYNLIKIR
jgi:hypothetical protein